MTETKHEDTWNCYSAIWGLASADAKLVQLTRCLAKDCTYLDPMTRNSGRAELLEYMQAFQDRFPGSSFQTTYFSSHNQRSTANWNMLNASGEVVSNGTSFAEYNDSGELTSLTGFFEVPAQ